MRKHEKGKVIINERLEEKEVNHQHQLKYSRSIFINKKIAEYCLNEILIYVMF